VVQSRRSDRQTRAAARTAAQAMLPCGRNTEVVSIYVDRHSQPDTEVESTEHPALSPGPARDDSLVLRSSPYMQQAQHIDRPPPSATDMWGANKAPNRQALQLAG
jgi:hypothetical protein